MFSLGLLFLGASFLCFLLFLLPFFTISNQNQETIVPYALVSTNHNVQIKSMPNKKMQSSKKIISLAKPCVHRHTHFIY